MAGRRTPSRLWRKIRRPDRAPIGRFAPSLPRSVCARRPQTHGNDPAEPCLHEPAAPATGLDTIGSRSCAQRPSHRPDCPRAAPGRRTGYRWCLDRLRARLAHVDMVRLDHFRAFAAAWHIPIGAATAQTGRWVPGPGAEFFSTAAREFGALPLIAEDLGLITPDVSALRDQFRLPGMRVLQFAFDGKSENPHLPQNYVPNTVVYTGTHDNPTTRGWFEELPDQQKQHLWNYLKRLVGESREVASMLINLAWSSTAGLAIAPLQDILNLGNEARMNLPGRAEGNWRWRCTEDMLTPAAFQWFHDLTKTSNREVSKSNIP